MSIFMEIIKLFCWTDLKNFESFLKKFSKNFKNSEILLTGDEKGGRIGSIKKKAEKEMNKRQAVTMNQNFYFSYFR